MSENASGRRPIDQSKLRAVLDRARREVDECLLPSVQIAIARNGELIAEEAYGDADLDTRYCLFSATKPFVASTVWTLIAEESVDISDRVTVYLPEFGAEGKADITVEQVMLHTSGFPHAPMGPPIWGDPQARRHKMAAWRLNWEPGTRYEYHPTAAHWVLAGIIEAVTDQDFREVVAQRVTEPAALPRVVGVPLDDQTGIADLVLVGEPATPDELEAAFGVRELPATEVNDDVVLAFNRPEVREVGVPGGGGFARARDLALFYQQLLHNTTGIWDPALLADATGTVRNTLPDPMGLPANRSLGLVLAGDDGKSHIRGLGRTVSAQAFGHNGAGGQLAWADPATGLSLAYLTNGYDRHEVRQPRRGTSISSLAATILVD